MEKNDWTRQLHERLDNHKTAVPDGVWDDIERRLDATRRPRRPRRALLVASWLTAAAAVALLLVGVFHHNETALTPLPFRRRRQKGALRLPIMCRRQRFSLLSGL